MSAKVPPPVTPSSPSSPRDERLAELVDQELKRCLDRAAEGLHWVGPDGTILWANQTELDLLGYAHEEYVGRNIAEFHADPPVIADILTRLTGGDTLLNYEARLRHKDGSLRFVQINSNVLRCEGRFLHTQCFTRDVTDRKVAAELALRLADIVGNSDDAIISKDLDGVITSWNAAAERLYGYTAAEAIGRPLAIIVPPGREQEQEDVVRRIRGGERVPSFETVRRHASGALIPVALTVSPIRDRDGRIIGASKMARDISSRQRLEARDRFLVALDDAVRPLADPGEITFTAAAALGRHLAVDRCAYATVEEDEDTFRQFGEAGLHLLRSGHPYVVTDSTVDERITEADRPPSLAADIRAAVCAPILKHGRLVAALAVHSVHPRQWRPDEVELVQRVASRGWESIERARVTRDLEESEHLFRALANSIANLAWMARPDGFIYWYNDQWYAYTGTTPAEMEGYGWERVHDPAVLPEVKARWQASIASGTPFEMVFPLRGADGTSRRFLTRVNPVRDSRGHVSHWFGTNTDVEDERRATEANAVLREREHLARQEAELQKRLLHSLFMQAPTLIAVLRGPDHVVELANPPACLVWERPEHALLNRPLFEVMPELGDQVFRSRLEEVYRTGVAHAGKETPVIFAREGGASETVYFNFVYSPFRNIDGEIEGIFLIASEVTEQVLAREQVNELREAAEAANRAKDEFLAMLGHELRNPLSPILTALQLMRLRGRDGSERERTVIERQVTHLTRLVDDLLDVSRIARGKVELKEEIVEIADVVASAVEMTGPLLEGRMHTLHLDVPRRGLAVKGDPTRLFQVVSNLLTNAAKYTPPGGRIHASAAAEGGEVALRIRDTGIGISAEVLPQIFELFVQERQPIDRSQGGLGLGLTIVRNLIERHGGTVAARSEGAGQGSEFIVRLPKAASAGLSRDSEAPAARAKTIHAAVDLPKILVVDDNEDAAEMLASALEAKGYVTRVAHDAPAGLRIAAEFRPGIALLDIGLPVMDGYELAARLREMPGLAGIRLIALTGYGQESDRQRTLAAGFQHHLVKPVDLGVIEALISG